MALTVFLEYILLYLLIPGLIVFVVLIITLWITTKPFPVVERSDEETTYIDNSINKRIQFSSLEDNYSMNLSVIVPAYNEEHRLPPMLDEALEFLEGRQKEMPAYKYEIIVVSDGSTDGTVEIAESYSAKYGSEKVKCLKLIKNRGKGGAVRLGVQSSRGAIILFADADGATTFADLPKLELAIKDLVHVDPVRLPQHIDDVAIVIGSRAHLEKKSLATRSIFRNILMYGFHFLVWLLAVQNIRDTQCGFKLFTRKAAKICFKNLHVNRWAFDVELLYIAQKLKIPITEIAVQWTEIEGSKVTPVFSWIQMGCDLGLIWLKYKIGAWRLLCDRIE